MELEIVQAQQQFGRVKSASVEPKTPSTKPFLLQDALTSTSANTTAPAIPALEHPTTSSFVLRSPGHCCWGIYRPTYFTLPQSAQWELTWIVTYCVASITVFKPFPVSKSMYLFYFVFLLQLLSSHCSVVNSFGITTHINCSLIASFTFLQDYVYLAKRAICRILGECVACKEPITVKILFKLFTHFDYDNPLHVAFFSFVRISNLVPYKLSDIGDPQACYLCRV